MPLHVRISHIDFGWVGIPSEFLDIPTRNSYTIYHWYRFSTFGDGQLMCMKLIWATIWATDLGWADRLGTQNCFRGPQFLDILDVHIDIVIF